jgi:hypothetical protein
VRGALRQLITGGAVYSINAELFIFLNFFIFCPLVKTLRHFSPSRTVKSDLSRHKSVVSNIFSLLSISVYILKSPKLSLTLSVHSQSNSVSNGENVSKPNLSADSVPSYKTLSENENLSNPETLKNTLKNSQITQLCHSPKHFQTTKNQFLVKPVLAFRWLFDHPIVSFLKLTPTVYLYSLLIPL